MPDDYVRSISAFIRSPVADEIRPFPLKTNETVFLAHGVLGYSRWKNDAFLAAISHWFLTQHHTRIDPQSVVYGPSVIYMVSELTRQWSSVGDGVVVHTPAYDAFYKAIAGNQRVVYPIELEKHAEGLYCDMTKLEALFVLAESKILLL